MAVTKPEDYSDIYFDVLNEISNIGTGNATAALSVLMDMDVDIEVPITKNVDFDSMSNLMGGKEETAVAVLIGLSGDIEGMMMFVMNKSSADNLINSAQRKPTMSEIKEYSEMDISALTEVGNILAGSYLAAISKFTGLTIIASVPAYAIDMAGAVMDIPVTVYGSISDNVLLIESKIKSPVSSTEGYFLLIPTLESVETLYKLLA